MLVQVLILDPGPRESTVQENGKVVVEDGQSNPLLQYPYDHHELKKEERPLKLRKKLYEFYTAPISKFWGHSVSFCRSFPNGMFAVSKSLRLSDFFLFLRRLPT